MTTEIKVRRFNPADENALFAFRKRIIAPGSNDLNREYFRWKFLNQPYTDKIPLFILETEGRIVGTQGYLSMPMVVGNKVVPCAHLVDFNVEDSFKGLAAVRLFKAINKQTHVNFISNLSEDARKFFKSARWIDLSSQLYSVYFFIKSPFDLSERAARFKFTLASLLRGFKLRRSTSKTFSAQYRIEFANSCPSNINHIFGQSSEDGELYFKKDIKFLKWRYDSCPVFKYQYAILTAKGIPQVLLIYCFVNSGKLQKCIIMDILHNNVIDTHVISHFLACHIKYCRDIGIDLVEGVVSSQFTKEAFLRVGFRSNKSDLGFMIDSKDKELRQVFLSGVRLKFMMGDTDRN